MIGQTFCPIPRSLTLRVKEWLFCFRPRFQEAGIEAFSLSFRRRESQLSVSAPGGRNRSFRSQLQEAGIVAFGLLEMNCCTVFGHYCSFSFLFPLPWKHGFLLLRPVYKCWLTGRTFGCEMLTAVAIFAVIT